MSGSGERVCYIINDLLNRELIKQNFRFKDPIIGNDQELEESKEEQISPDPYQDKQVVDESKTSLRKYFEYCDSKSIEDELLKNVYIETAYDEEEYEMIMPGVDVDDWQKEFNRVSKYIDKDLDAHGNVIEHSNTLPKNLVDVTDIDDLLDKIDRITIYFQSISEFMEGEGR